MEQTVIQKKKAVEFFLKKEILVSSDLLAGIDDNSLDCLSRGMMGNEGNFLFLNNDLSEAVQKGQHRGINWIELESSKAFLERGKDNKVYSEFLAILNTVKQKPAYEKVKVIFSHDEDSKKRDIQDFVKYFNARYQALEKILKQRPDLRHVTAISRIKNKKDREEISLIGIVSDKQLTKNKNLVLTLEDPTGSINVIVNKNKPDVFEEAKSIVHDEVIAVTGVNGQNILFANKIYWPEVITKEIKKCKDECYALFLSDIHVGSKNFLPESFNKFLAWLNGTTGSESQKELASKVKYIFIAGDLVDGVGVYPNQDKELEIKDIYGQYEECARLLGQIPKNISVIICPGNHDAIRGAEPQPALYADFAKAIYQIPNILCLSNPCFVNIHSSEDFSGFDVLLYHGYSFDYFVANVDAIRNNGGYNRADLIMKFLLKRRHLAPTHTSTLYVPEETQDPLVIGKVPDFFVTGHVHKSIAANYRNITLISGSCWQSKTSFQEKVGHNPEPGRVPMVNLKTREIKILKFL